MVDDFLLHLIAGNSNIQNCTFITHKRLLGAVNVAARVKDSACSNNGDTNALSQVMIQMCHSRYVSSFTELVVQCPLSKVRRSPQAEAGINLGRETSLASSATNRIYITPET